MLLLISILLQVDHISAASGIRMPVESIASVARANDIWLHVDGAQACGAIDLAMSDLGAHSYAASCHKWMGAPHGTVVGATGELIALVLRVKCFS